MTTNGLSFYQTQAGTAELAISYAFDALSENDITVMVIASDDSRIYLTKDTHFTLDFPNQTITCLEPSWDSISGVAESSEIRIYRTTSVLPLIDFKAGAVLSEGDLDISYKQGLFAAQEAVEDAADTGAGLQSVPSSVIEDGAIVSSKLAPDAVTTDKIADNAVTAVKLEANSITSFQMAPTSVDTLNLVNGSVTTTKLDNLAVETEKIANGAVTQVKVDKASQDNMQDQSSTDGVVTPDVLKYSPFAPRAYGSVTYDTSAPALSPGSYNVDDSVSEPTEDQRTITFSVPLADNNYVVVATMQAANAVGLNEIVTITNKSTTSFTMESTHNDEDGLRINFVVFGSTLDES